MCRLYVVLYKGLEHPQNLAFTGDPGTSPPSDTEGLHFADVIIVHNQLTFGKGDYPR